MKRLMFLLLVAAMLLTAASCSGGGESSDAEKKEYIVGFDNTFAPMGFEKDGENMGFDIDLAKKVEEKMGVKFKFQPIDWTLKETELNSNNIDMIWNGYSITDERKEKVLFSDPYMKNRVLILVNKGSGIKNKSDLKGKIVCTQDQSSSLDALLKDDMSDGLKEIVTYPSFNDVFNDLDTERCDAIVIDETMGLYYVSTAGDTDKYDVLEEDLGMEEYGVGFRKDDSKFVEDFNKALKELKEEGEIDKIYKKWFK